jgi:hypothetical protein
VIGWLLRQHVIERELARRADIEVKRHLLAAAVAAFRTESELTNELALTDWLGGRGRSRSDFEADVDRRLRLEIMKHDLTRPDLETHFERRRPFLDRAVVTVFPSPSLEAAEELAKDLPASAAAPAAQGGDSSWREVMRLVDLPKQSNGVSEDSPTQGLIVGPIERDGDFAVLRIDEIVPASLADEETRRRIRDELFELWLAQQLEKLDVELVVP